MHLFDVFPNKCVKIWADKETFCFQWLEMPVKSMLQEAGFYWRKVSCIDNNPWNVLARFDFFRKNILATLNLLWLLVLWDIANWLSSQRYTIELKCKHHGNPTIAKMIDCTQLHTAVTHHYTQNSYRSLVSRKNSNLSAEFEVVMGNQFNLDFFGYIRIIVEKTDRKLTVCNDSINALST